MKLSVSVLCFYISFWMPPLISGGQLSFVKMQLSAATTAAGNGKKSGPPWKLSNRQDQTRPDQTQIQISARNPRRPIQTTKSTPINPSTLPHSHLPLNCISLPAGVLLVFFFRLLHQPRSSLRSPQIPSLGCTPRLGHRRLLPKRYAPSIIIIRRCPPQLPWTRDSNPSNSCHSPL